MQFYGRKLIFSFENTFRTYYLLKKIVRGKENRVLTAILILMVTCTRCWWLCRGCSRGGAGARLPWRCCRATWWRGGGSWRPRRWAAGGCRRPSCWPTTGLSGVGSGWIGPAELVSRRTTPHYILINCSTASASDILLKAALSASRTALSNIRCPGYTLHINKAATWTSHPVTSLAGSSCVSDESAPVEVNQWTKGRPDSANLNLGGEGKTALLKLTAPQG